MIIQLTTITNSLWKLPTGCSINIQWWRKLTIIEHYATKRGKKIAFLSDVLSWHFHFNYNWKIRKWLSRSKVKLKRNRNLISSRGAIAHISAKKHQFLISGFFIVFALADRQIHAQTSIKQYLLRQQRSPEGRDSIREWVGPVTIFVNYGGYGRVENLDMYFCLLDIYPLIIIHSGGAPSTGYGDL